MAKKKETIRRFAEVTNMYWVDGKPYVVEGEVIYALCGLTDEKEVEKLKEFLK